MPKTLSLEEFAKAFPQFGDELVRELNYAVRQETAKELVNDVKARTPVAAAGTLSKGSISKTPGELKRAWRVLRGSRSIRGQTRVVNSRHAAIVNEPYRRLPKGGAVGSPQAPEGMTKPAERAVNAASERIKAAAIARTEALMARRHGT